MKRATIFMELFFGFWIEEFAAKRTSILLRHESEQGGILYRGDVVDRSDAESDERIAMQLSQLF